MVHTAMLTPLLRSLDAAASDHEGTRIRLESSG
jgi:hypothetical protein